MNRMYMVVVGLLIAGISGILMPTARAGSSSGTLLRYAFRQGAIFTTRFSLASIEAIEQPGYADRRYHEVDTGLEQATVAQVFADGAALFRYRFAGLVDASSAAPASLIIDTGGPPAPVAATHYTITQAVAADGHAEPATQQCNPSAGLDDLAPFTLLPLAPILYAHHPVAVGDAWTAPLPPDDDVVRQAHVQFMSQQGTSGSFTETAMVPIHIVDPTLLGRISGTTAMTVSATQDLVTGVPSSWSLRVTTQVSRTDVPLTPGKPVTLRIQSSQTLSATPIPTPTPLALPTETPVVQPLSPAESALARLNLGTADLPACYHVAASLPVTPRVEEAIFHTTASGLRAGHVVGLVWYPAMGQSGVVLWFVDDAHAHAFLVQESKTLKQPQVSPPDLHGIHLGDEQRVGYGEPYGPFDLALRELAYNNRVGEFDVIFRRGPYMVYLSLVGDFAPIDLGIYGRRIDTRLQRAIAASKMP